MIRKRFRANAPNQRERSKGIGVFLGLFVVGIGLVALLVQPQKVSAFVPLPAPTYPVPLPTVDVPQKKENIIQRIITKYKEKLKIASDIAYKNALKVYLGKLAEDTAVWVSSAGTGQKPLFLTEPDYFKKLNDAAAGDFLDTLSKGVFGVNLCAPDLAKQLQLEVTVRGILKPANACEDMCTREYNAKIDQSEGFVEGDIGKVPRTVTQVVPDWVMDTPQGNYWTIASAEAIVIFLRDEKQSGGTADFDYFCKQSFPAPPPGNTWLHDACIAEYEQNIAEAKANATADLRLCTQQCAKKKRVASCSFSDISKNVSNPELLTGNVAEYFKPGNNDLGQLLAIYGQTQDFQALAVQGEKDVLNYSGVAPIRSKVSGKIEAPGLLTGEKAKQTIAESTAAEKIQTGSPWADAISIFSNTLVAKLTERFFKGKCGLNPDACKGPSGAGSRLGSLLFGGNLTGIRAAKLRFASLARADYLTGDPSRNAISVTEKLVADGIIDERFKQAIDEELTVRQAMDKGLLDPKKTFGFTQNGIEPADGYPFRSMLFLRKYRVVPVGWELAAKYLTLIQFIPPVTLGELVKNYDVLCQAQCDDGDASNDEYNPYYHLIDPNWVLKAPQTFCRKMGAGEEVLTREFLCDADNRESQTGLPAGITPGYVAEAPNCNPGTQRTPNPYHDEGRWTIQRATEVCADEQSCVSENPDGSCRAYGYCIEERPAWKFPGDACDAQFATCTKYRDQDGAEVSYNTNTLDTRGCSADVAGCTKYCTSFSGEVPGFPNDSNKWTCEDPVYFQTLPPAGPGLPVDYLRLDRDVEVCEGGAEGCHEFLRTTVGSNLLPNASFELIRPGDIVGDGFPDEFFNRNEDGDPADPDEVLGWINHGNVQAEAVTTDNAGVGSANTIAAKIRQSAIPSNDYLYDFFNTGYDISERTFTLSYYGRSDGVTPCQGEFGMEVKRAGPGYHAAQNVAEYTTAWQRYTVTLTLDQPPYDPQNIIESYIRSSDICDIVVDNAKTEDGPVMSAYTDYGQVNQLYLNKNREQCTADEVGCERYTPVDGSPPIAGVVRQSDRCPPDQVGCRTWREMPITHIPLRGGAMTYVNFIANTGQQCSAASVGCEEYTNLDEVAQGGEGRHYYSQIRLCVEPTHPDVRTYYTWQGSQESGYQLRTHRLLASNRPGYDGPCTNIEVPGVGIQARCTDNVNASATCLPSQVGIDPDCTEYFDLNLQPYYLLRSRTVSASDDCHPFRNTIDGNLPIYPIIPSEAIACPAQDAGCREYKGNTGNSTRTVFADDFEDGDVAGWTGGVSSMESLNVGGRSMSVAGPDVYYDLDPDPDAPLVSEGRSYTASFWAKQSIGANVQLGVRLWNSGTSYPFPPLPATIPLTTEWQFYTVGPALFAGAPAGDVRFLIRAIGGPSLDFFLDNVLLRESSDSAYIVKDTFTTCAAADVNCQAYTDRRGQAHALKSFTRLCRDAAIGCEALIDTRNSTTPNLQDVKGVQTPEDATVTAVNNPGVYCRAEDKGCTKVGKPIVRYQDDGTILVPIPHDTLWVKNDPDRHQGILCEEPELDCREYTNEDTGSLTFFHDPLGRLCEFRSGNASVKRCNVTFAQACTADADCPPGPPPEFCQSVGGRCSITVSQPCRDNADCPAAESCLEVSGPENWFLSGTANTLCPSFLSKGSLTGLVDGCEVRTIAGVERFCYKSSNAATDECKPCVVRTCPDNQSSCTEYRDPTDPDPCRSNCTLTIVEATGEPEELGPDCTIVVPPVRGVPGCRAYYFLKQTLASGAADCASQIDPEAGCRPFQDTSNPELNFRGR